MAKFGKKVPVKEISCERMNILFDLAASAETPEEAARYVGHACDISRRQRVRPTKEQKRMFCRSCGAYFVPGRNVSVRIARGRIITTCRECGRITRIPIIRDGHT